MNYHPPYYYFQPPMSTSPTGFQIENTIETVLVEEKKPLKMPKNPADSERKRRRRESLTADQLSQLRAREAQRKRSVRAKLPEDKLAELRAKDAQRKRIYRAQLAIKSVYMPEKLAELRAKDAQRKRKKRSLLSPDKLAEIRAKDAAYKRMYREQMRLKKQNPVPAMQPDSRRRNTLNIQAMTS